MIAIQYVVLLTPALLVLTVAGVIYQFARIGHRVQIEDAELGTRKVTKVHEPGKRLRRALTIAAAGFTISAALVITPPGHRGVIYSQSGGVQTTERVEGLSFIVPYFQSAIYMNVRTQVWEADLKLQTKDVQEVEVPLAVNFHADPRLAAELYQSVGRDYADIVIRPAALQIAKAEVGQVIAEAFPQQRDAIAAAVNARLTAELAPRGIVVEFTSIKDAVFQPGFINSVERKVVAAQDAITEANKIQLEENRKQQAIRRAEGEAAAIEKVAAAQAQANRDIAASLDSDLLTWARIQKWGGQLPETFLGDGDPLDLLFNINP
jgi:regulator of protease activity HflC (stomatin/prohibitin superfamily)